jgi:hypothetical protein
VLTGKVGGGRKVNSVVGIQVRHDGFHYGNRGLDLRDHALDQMGFTGTGMAGKYEGRTILDPVMVIFHSGDDPSLEINQSLFLGRGECVHINILDSTA